jgi:hypothetical protein
VGFKVNFSDLGDKLVGIAKLCERHCYEPLWPDDAEDEEPYFATNDLSATFVARRYVDVE